MSLIASVNDYICSPMSGGQSYETVVGLEVHAQLLTASKLFCSDSTQFGAEPNTQISPITLAHPGTLPMINRKAIEFAVRMGLACHCEIARENYFARKNYFYPDLPKGYQVSQHTTPICKGGFVEIQLGEEKKKIRLNRIHLEEDAGKSLHDVDPEYTSIDLNRAGVALIEIVSEPDIRSGDEAYAYLTELRKLVRYLGICDGNMEEGSLRCDANISVRKRGEEKLGTKVEIKNLNSIRHVKKAIEAESTRLIGLVESGGKVIQETRSFDAQSGISFSMREKEEAEDYRYFPEPDLTKFVLDTEFISLVRQSVPELQAEKKKRFVEQYGLSEYDATVLTEEKQFANFFEKVVQQPGLPSTKSVANWMLQPVRNWMNDQNAEINQFPLTPQKMSELISLVDSGQMSFSVASTRLLSALLQNPSADPRLLAERNGWLQERDKGFNEELIDRVLEKFPEKVSEYRKGKKGLMALFVGEVMKLSKGKADPKLTTELLTEKLK